MKQVKIAYDKCKAKMPHRPPDEIDFGLGFQAALETALSLNSVRVHDDVYEDIKKELEG